LDFYKKKRKKNFFFFFWDRLSSILGILVSFERNI
jgi:hypothetical protein